jgi:hypothetical protein
MWDSEHLISLQDSTTCYADSFTYFISNCNIKLNVAGTEKFLPNGSMCYLVGGGMLLYRIEQYCITRELGVRGSRWLEEVIIIAEDLLLGSQNH